MAEELADTHAAEQPQPEVSTGAEIGAEAPQKSERPQSVRETIKASIKEIGERERDQAGKFVSKDKAPEKVEPKATPGGGASATEAVGQEPKKASGPPPGWSQASKDYFNSLPPDHPIRSDVAKREDEVSKGFKDYSDKTKRYEEIERVLAPSRAVYQQFGARSDAEAISRLIEWEAAIRTDPRGGIQRLAQQLGIDLSQFARLPESSTVPDGYEQLRPILDEFGQIKQQFNGVLAAQAQAEQAKINADLQNFAKDHPHFEAIRVSMGRLMAAGEVQPGDLESAYQKALRLNDELHAQSLAEAEEKRKAEIAKTQAEQAKNARLAAVSPGPRAPQSPAGQVKDRSSKGVRASIMNSIADLRDRA